MSKRIEIIPAIDLIDGGCVRLSQGDYNQVSRYSTSPLEMAKQFEAVGVERLHIVDLEGAKEAFPKNLKVLEQVCSATNLRVEFGGGIKSTEAIKSVFNAGATYAICGTVAVKEPELFRGWLKEFGGEKIVLGADVKDGKVAVSGWEEASKMGVVELIENFREDGLKYLLCTEISKDGMLCGPAFELYKELQERYAQIDVMVSGGVSGMSDIERLNEMELRSVIVGKAIYEGRISLKQIEKWLLNE